MLRREIYWCDLDPARGQEQARVRPAVIVSQDNYNSSRSPLVAIVPLTRAALKSPVHVKLEPDETGLAHPSTALLDHLRFIDRSRIQPQRIGKVTALAMKRLDRYIGLLLGLADPAILSE